jgi:hypothetical protein
VRRIATSGSDSKRPPTETAKSMEAPESGLLSEVGIDKNLADRARRARRGPATLRATAAFI